MKSLIPNRVRIYLAILCFSTWVPLVAADAAEPPADPYSTAHNSSIGFGGFEETSDTGITPSTSNERPPEPAFDSARLKELMRPNFRFAGEWQAKTNGIGITEYDSRVDFPTYPLFGPPPPFINVGFGYTNLDVPTAFDLPTNLYETELGLAWMRRFNDRWMARFMAGASFATDGNNTSSDAWRFRGGGFAIYRRNPVWTWTIGAIALGRNDLPVVPAVGVIYQPNATCRLDLIMPRPRFAVLLKDNGPRQQWGFFGAAINGTTWGVERADRTDDQLTYGDVRLVLGWESTPTPEPGMPFTRGRKLGVEVGYVFSRDFRWENDESKVRLDDTLLLRGSVSF